MDNLARLLKESWVLVEDRRDQLASHFYARLFVTDPTLRTLFPVQMSVQRERLLEAIVAATGSVGDPERFDEFLRSLGRDHRKFHVRPEHYTALGAALLHALRTFGGDQWTVEYDQAWTEAYAAMAERMQAGAAADDNPPYWNAEVLGHERRGTDIAVITCRPLLDPLPYRAGQYVSVEAPRHRPRLWRTYSIANAPREDNVLEFHVRVLGAGWVSGALVRQVQPGDLLRLAAPMGSMTLDPTSTRDVVCVAAGVGLAPIKALVEELSRGNRTRWVHVFVGGRTREDLYGLPELNRIAARHPWLSVVPCCSDDLGFDGEQGDVSDVLARYGPWKGHDCFVAGSTTMVRSALRVLAEHEVPAESIRYDTFGTV
ncbi:globin domain-containing protein [Micromonospora zhanjiangensis]|uniref:nitric oxide dioxygenase n=1 Tax=Micromonospora zhanjiangensis TaxID=1522057 RepID=A0ABV8KKX7_9ACTN